MEKISNEPKLVESINGLINDCDYTRQIGEFIDDVIFDYIYCMIVRKECLAPCDEHKIYILRKVRDLFWDLETEQVERTLQQSP